MKIAFLIAAVVAVVAAVLAITRKKPVHALLYLVVSLLAVSFIFFILGAPLAAALEVIVYAGAIMVLFIFVIMMLNRGDKTLEQENLLLKPRTWTGPVILVFILFVQWLYIVISQPKSSETPFVPIGAKQVGVSLFGTYALGVELASILLLAALVGALHVSRRHNTADKGGQTR
jgi:NADH-quinone oxidoreductase subunit J